MMALCLYVLHNLKPNNYAAFTTSRVLDLKSTLRLPINTNTHRKPNIDLFATESIPSSLILSGGAKVSSQKYPPYHE